MLMEMEAVKAYTLQMKDAFNRYVYKLNIDPDGSCYSTEIDV